MFNIAILYEIENTIFGVKDHFSRETAAISQETGHFQIRCDKYEPYLFTSTKYLLSPIYTKMNGGVSISTNVVLKNLSNITVHI